MTTITLDTHRFVENLRRVDMPKKQAEAVVDMHAKVLEHLATKDDLRILKRDVLTWVLLYQLASLGVIVAVFG